MSQIIQLKKALLFSVTAILFTGIIFSQETAKIRTFSGAITATNNGISTFPNLSLGKPAAIFDFSIKSKRWSFDPQLRFSMEGKPWTFLFWGRYKAINDKKIASATFSDLPKATYAVAVFHDKNKNGVMDKNLVGVPTEKYGFSNNARETFSAPSFESASVKVEGQKTIWIYVK